jgi:hypothetical protein
MFQRFRGFRSTTLCPSNSSRHATNQNRVPWLTDLNDWNGAQRWNGLNASLFQAIAIDDLLASR